MIVVADTSGIIAAFDRNAPEGPACRKLLQEAGTVVLSPLVLAEVDHLARARLGAAARSTILELLTSQVRRMRFQVPDVCAETLTTALAVMTRYARVPARGAAAAGVAAVRTPAPTTAAMAAVRRRERERKNTVPPTLPSGRCPRVSRGCRGPSRH